MNMSRACHCWYLTVLGFALAACASDPGPSGPRDDAAPDPVDGALPATGILVSGAVPRSLVPNAPGAAGSLVFVAAAPISVRGAKYARILSSRGDSVTTQAFSGGFDPLPIRGEDGDVVTVTVVDSADRETTTRLPARAKPPRVVRTSPAPNRADVPLNIRVTVVFSTPMESEAAQGVHLVRDGLDVAGTVLVAPDGLSVEFTPSVPLASNTTYELRVERGVRDVVGGELVELVIAPFATGALAQDHGRLLIESSRAGCLDACYIDLSELMVGDSADVRAFNEWYGGPDADVSARWSSAAPGVLRVTETGRLSARVVALAAGTATLAAEVEGRVGTRAVQVYASIADDLLIGTSVYRGNSSGVRRVRLDGGEVLPWFSVSELPADSTLCPEFGLMREECYYNPHRFAVTPSGRIAVTRLSDLGGVWVKDSRLAPLRRVNSPLERGAAYAPTWSPDGERLAYWIDFFADAMAELRVVDANGTGQRTLLRVPFDTVVPPDADPMWWNRPQGGAQVVWHADGARLLMYSTEGTQQVHVDGAGMSLYLPGFLPGPWLAGGRIQFVYDVSDQRTYRADANGVVARDSFVVGIWPTAVSPDDRLMAAAGGIWRLDGSARCCIGDHILGFAAP
jgi:hypothetical protein